MPLLCDYPVLSALPAQCLVHGQHPLKAPCAPNMSLLGPCSSGVVCDGKLCAFLWGILDLSHSQAYSSFLKVKGSAML